MNSHTSTFASEFGFITEIPKIIINPIRTLSVLALLVVVGVTIVHFAGYMSNFTPEQWQEVNGKVYGNEPLGWTVIVLSAYGVVLFDRVVAWRKKEENKQA